MTKDTKFKPGHSGNPKGKPRGAKDKRTELRELLKPHAGKLIKKAVDLAMSGDTTALKLCLDRIVAPIKPQGVPVSINSPGGSLTQQGSAIIAAATEGLIPPDDASQFLRALAAQAKLVEIEDLESRISTLEKRVAS
jgi:hypothetical protein